MGALVTIELGWTSRSKRRRGGPRARPLAATLAAFASASPGCGDDGSSTGDTMTASATATATTTASATGTSGSSGDSDSASGGDSTGTSSTDTTSSESTSTSTTTTTGDETSSSSTTGAPIDPRYEALVAYAPRVWLDEDEVYFPSSVEFAFPHMTRFADGNGDHWIRSTEPLESPSDTLPFFAGDLDGAPVYAFYADKGMDVVDLVYFFWYPYNRGKEVVDTIWGNHVGDWEHITVRLLRGPDDTLSPSQVYLSAHSFVGIYEWADVERHAEQGHQRGLRFAEPPAVHRLRWHHAAAPAAERRHADQWRAGDRPGSLDRW